MKYLPIHQSVLKVDKKYSYIMSKSNNLKYRFGKHAWFSFNFNNGDYRIYVSTEYNFRKLFLKYFHNDIEINWNK